MMGNKMRLHGLKAIIIKGTLSSILLVDIPYSRKYWRSLNLVVWSRAAEIKILADFNLAVVARTAKFNSPPNFPAIRYINKQN